MLSTANIWALVSSATAQKNTLLLVKSICSTRESSDHCCDWWKYKEIPFVYLCYRFHMPIWVYVWVYAVDWNILTEKQSLSLYPNYAIALLF